MSRRERAWDRTWWPPTPSLPPTREARVAETAEQPSWPRARRPSPGQAAAVAARPGHGLPPATAKPPPNPAPEPEPPAVVVAEQWDGCGRSDRPSWARPLGQMLPPDPRAQRPPGWGRDSGGCG
jgi:hypothetical protein